MDEGKFGKYIIQELQEPKNSWTPEFQAMYRKFSDRILWLDNNVVEGAIQMNTAWYFAVPERDPVFEDRTINRTEDNFAFVYAVYDIQYNNNLSSDNYGRKENVFTLLRADKNSPWLIMRWEQARN